MRSLKAIAQYRFYFLCIPLIFCQISVAQESNSVESGKYFGTAFSFSTYVPGGDLADRFGSHFSLGVSPQFKIKKNFIFSANAQFIFGNDVKQPNLLHELRSDRGEVLDEDGQIATILLFQRGYSLTLRVEKLFAINKEKNKNSGFIVGFGAGFLQHKIRIEHQNNRIPQLENEYIKGYDRLSNGLLLEQNIGYYHVSRSKLTNFKVELVFNQGLTESRRDFNFDDNAKDDTQRLDLFTGARFTWLLPLYRRMANEYYIN